jgi:hypothetical protein
MMICIAAEKFSFFDKSGSEPKPPNGEFAGGELPDGELPDGWLEPAALSVVEASTVRESVGEAKWLEDALADDAVSEGMFCSCEGSTGDSGELSCPKAAAGTKQLPAGKMDAGPVRTKEINRETANARKRGPNPFGFCEFPICMRAILGEREYSKGKKESLKKIQEISKLMSIFPRRSIYLDPAANCRGRSHRSPLAPKRPLRRNDTHRNCTRIPTAPASQRHSRRNGAGRIGLFPDAKGGEDFPQHIVGRNGAENFAQVIQRRSQVGRQ